eukprot:757906-Hanusia_phi.AAC.3
MPISVLRTSLAEGRTTCDHTPTRLHEQLLLRSLATRAFSTKPHTAHSRWLSTSIGCLPKGLHQTPFVDWKNSQRTATNYNARQEIQSIHSRFDIPDDCNP